MKKLLTAAIITLNASSIHADYMCEYHTNYYESTSRMFTSKVDSCIKFGCNQFEKQLVYNLGKNTYEALLNMIRACNVNEKDANSALKALEELVNSFK